MRRLAILDHADHTLMVEDVNDADIEAAGGEEEYIKKNYTFEGDFSWDWIVDAEYYAEGESDPIEIDFDEIADI